MPVCFNRKQPETIYISIPREKRNMAAGCDGTTRGEKACLPFQVGHLPKSIVAKAEKELGETEEVRDRALHEMRKLISQEPDFTCPTVDIYLLQYLRCRKFDVDKGFKQLQSTWNVKRKFGFLYDKYDPESLRRTFGLKCMFCLPYRDEGGAAIYTFKLRNWDPDVCTANQLVTALTIVCYTCSLDPVTQVCGIRLLIDAGGMCFKQLRHFNATLLFVLASALKGAIPARWVGIHIYNESVMFSMMWTIFKGFLSEKLRSRVHFHSTKTEGLLKFIPKEVLPVEYGGDNKDDVGAWYNAEVAESSLKIYKMLINNGYRK